MCRSKVVNNSRSSLNAWTYNDSFKVCKLPKNIGWLKVGWGKMQVNSSLCQIKHWFLYNHPCEAIGELGEVTHTILCFEWFSGFLNLSCFVVAGQSNVAPVTCCSCSNSSHDKHLVLLKLLWRLSSVVFVVVTSFPWHHPYDKQWLSKQQSWCSSCSMHLQCTRLTSATSQWSHPGLDPMEDGHALQVSDSDQVTCECDVVKSPVLVHAAFLAADACTVERQDRRTPPGERQTQVVWSSRAVSEPVGSA